MWNTSNVCYAYYDNLNRLHRVLQSGPTGAVGLKVVYFTWDGLDRLNYMHRYEYVTGLRWKNPQTSRPNRTRFRANVRWRRAAIQRNPGQPNGATGRVNPLAADSIVTASVRPCDGLSGGGALKCSARRA